MPEDLRVSGWGAVPGWYRVPAFILSRGWEEEGGKRKQEKGTVSRQVPSVCLHIVFSRDIPRFARDMLARNAGNPPFQARIREIRNHSGGPRCATTTSYRQGSVGSASKAETARDATLAASLPLRYARPRNGRSGAVASTASSTECR